MRNKKYSKLCHGVLCAFLIITFCLGPIQINFAKAITQNQIISEVQIVCPDNYGNYYSGSGTIIDPKGIILTNRHVVTDEFDSVINTCVVGFTESINQEPNFFTNNQLNLAEVKYTTTTEDMDAALLYLDNPTNKTYSYINIYDSSSSSLQFGDKVEVIGYPSIGGSTITYTSGDFSGFGSKSDGTQNYIKTTAPLEHGNSGGAAYNKANGQFIGIPTMAVVGSINSLSYILSIDSIKNWLSSILGSNYTQIIIEQQPVIKEPVTTIPDDVTPPDIKGYNIDYKIVNDDKNSRSSIQYYWQSSNVIDQSSIAKYYYYFGTSVTANPVTDGKSFDANNNGINNIPETFAIDSAIAKYLIISIQDVKGNVSSPIIAPWSIKDMITMGHENVIYSESRKNLKSPNKSILSKYLGYFVRIDSIVWFVNPRDSKKYLIEGRMENDWYYSNELNILYCNGGSTGITSDNLLKRPKNVWGHLLIEMTSGGVGGFYYLHPNTGVLYDFDGISSGGVEASAVLRQIESIAVDAPNNALDTIEIANPINSYYINHEMVPHYINKYIYPSNFIVTGTKNGGGPEVRLLTTSGKLFKNFNAYDNAFRGGINVGIADVNGDGKSEIITSPREGGAYPVKIFDVNGNNLKLDYYAYDKIYKGGVNIATADINADGKAEIITAPMGGSAPYIRMFSLQNGKMIRIIPDFLAYDINFRGGVAISVGDIDGDSKGEIVTSPISKGGPQIRVFGLRDGKYAPITVGIMAYAPNFHGGINSSVGDINSDGKDEIIIGIVSTGGPHVRIFGIGRDKKIGLISPGFMAYNPTFRGGISVAAEDINGDGNDEIITGVGSNGNPTIRIFDQNGKQVLKEFNAYSANYKSGVTVAAGQF